MDEGKLFALLTAFCFGLNPVMLKMGFARGGRTDVAVVIGLAVAVPIYLLLGPFAGGIQFDVLTIPAAVIGFVLGGLFGGGIGRRWMFLAIHHMGASPATAVKNSAPVISTILAVLLFGETVELIQWLAIIAIISGVTFVTWKGGGGRRQFLNIGFLAALGSALSYGIRPLFLELGLNAANEPLTGALIGAIAALVYAVLLTRPKDLQDGFHGRPLALFAFSGILQAIGFLAFTFGLSAGDVSAVYPVTSSAPLFTVAFTAILLRGTERVTWRIIAGVVLVVAGVIYL